mmetsp:Transcript_106811/g.300253  ORF Transcript_106811/g.300253 Transcript_106811/m.300253 type:complete len:200 (+) Transcript_106811:177-776(+)
MAAWVDRYLLRRSHADNAHPPPRALRAQRRVLPRRIEAFVIRMDRLRLSGRREVIRRPSPRFPFRRRIVGLVGSPRRNGRRRRRNPHFGRREFSRARGIHCSRSRLGRCRVRRGRGRHNRWRRKNRRLGFCRPRCLGVSRPRRLFIHQPHCMGAASADRVPLAASPRVRWRRTACGHCQGVLGPCHRSGGGWSRRRLSL